MALGQLDLARALPPYDLDPFSGFGAERRHDLRLDDRQLTSAQSVRRDDVPGVEFTQRESRRTAA